MDLNNVSSDPKKRRGRPPKNKPEPVQEPVPVFLPPTNFNSVAPPQKFVIGPVNTAPARARGRPPKRGLGQGAVVPRGKRLSRSTAPSPPMQVKGTGKPRGRPPKLTNVNAPEAPVAGKRRGRIPKSSGGQTNLPRKISGKRLGRPKKINNASSEAIVPSSNGDRQLLVAYLDLKGKLENLQSRMQEAVRVIKPSLMNKEEGPAVLSAIQELEMLASINIITSRSIDQQSLSEQPFSSDV